MTTGNGSQRSFLGELPILHQTSDDRDVRGWLGEAMRRAYADGDHWAARSFEVVLRRLDVWQRRLEDRDAEIRDLQDELSVAQTWEPPCP